MTLILRTLFKKLTLGHLLKPLGTISRYSASNTELSCDYDNPNKKQLLSHEFINKVNKEVENNEHGRLFAVIHICGKQFKVTEGDIIVIEGYWPPTTGDKLRLEKVMLLGSKHYTLIGTPLVQDGLVDIYATVIEKTLSHTKTNFKKKRRKQYTNINFYRVPQTMVRINEIIQKSTLDNPPDVTGLEYRVL